MIKPLLFTLMALLLLPAAALLVLELAFGQWMGSDPWAATRRLNLIRNEVIHYDVRHIVGHAQPVVRYKRDAHGLRGPCRAAEVDMLTVGGSTTDQRLIADGQTWQDVLAALAQSETNRRLCIANAGVDGHSTFGHLAAFETWFPLIPGLQPRYVLLYVGLNDVGRLAPQHGFDDTHHPDESRWYRLVRERSALFELWSVSGALFSALQPVLPYAGHRKEPPSAEAYTATLPSPGIDTLVERNRAAFEGRLQQILAYVRTMGALPICVSQPHRFALDLPTGPRGLPDALHFEHRFYNGLDVQRIIAALGPVMQRLCSADDGHFIDMQAAEFAGSDFYDVMHMTPAGARRFGALLHAELRERGIP